MSNSRFYNRTGRITFLDGNTEIDDFRGLNFKFSCEFMMSPSNGREARCDVGILGLPGELVHKMTTFSNGTTQEQYGEMTGGNVKQVRVYAGYDGEGFTANTPLFTLPIIGAWPTSPPNMWLNITAMQGSLGNTAEIDARRQSMFGPITFRSYAEYVAQGLGVKLDWEVEGYGGLGKNSWGLVGTETAIVKYLNEIHPRVFAYIDRSEQEPNTRILHVVEIDDLESDSDTLKKNKAANFDYIMGQQAEKGPTISVETGMVGLPKVTYGDGEAGSIEVTTLLRKDIGIHKRFTVKSGFIRYANGTFVCTKIKHSGEFRGKEWYTTFTGIPSDRFLL